MLKGAAVAAGVALSHGGSRSGSALAAAPQLGLSLPKHVRLQVGGFEVTMISDSEAFIDGPYPIIGKNANAEDVAALMHANFLPANRYQPGFSPSLINTGREIVLIDTGNGENGFIARPQAGWLASQLAPAGFKPEQIDVVVLSHGHPDHVGGLIDGGKPLFANARYVIGAAEYDFWSPEGKHTGELEKMASVFRSNTRAILDRFTFVKPGDEIVPGITALDAAGHTPGHLAFRIESNGAAIIFWGDCAHHQVASLARPDWHCVFDIDDEVAARTRERMFGMVAADRLPVIGYHMPFPSIGFVEAMPSRGYRWIPHTYQLMR